MDPPGKVVPIMALYRNSTRRSSERNHLDASGHAARNRRRIASTFGAAALAAGLCAGMAGNALATAPVPAAAAKLNPKVAPGGNFNLGVWELQLPIGSAGDPTTILPAQLEGAKGFQDKYFFTNTTDGGMSFWDPENGVTTPNSNYSRSELREMTASGAQANWFSAGTTNTLSASLKATQVPSHVCVGQIHLGSGGSTKPLLELFYYANGTIDMAIEQTPAGGNEKVYPVGTVKL
ncbi:MAG TPA: polysaccharide lyase family 7 protein, partial [Acidisoma sp.]|nr:polysaccharide lyase family 7 protein [Acidisoma sp.]